MSGPDQRALFISIASYRDPQLPPTIEDCLAKARHPERLRFGVCWQHGDGEVLPSWFGGERFRIVPVDWRDSLGPCWARAEAMRLWDGEEFYLQLDSHHRFVPDWDAKLIDTAAACDADKPILSTYPAAFTPGGELVELVTRIDFVGFDPDGIVSTQPFPLSPQPRPMRARFLAAAFLFAPGRFVEDVPYDPELYFIGEEITLAVRAYSHGYDLFHPHEHIVWHQYERSDQRKHWDDHTDVRPWHERDVSSKAKVRPLLTEGLWGRHGLGPERSLGDYERYAGLSFEHRRAQDYTRRQLEPPNPEPASDWPQLVRDFRVEVAIDTETVPQEALEPGAFWYFGAHDEAGAELFRQDLTAAALSELLARGAPGIEFVREFESEREPVSWTVIPHSPSCGWLQRISEPLAPPPANQRRPEPRSCSKPRAAEPLIFVSIAAYRDSELGPTVRDCLARACFPERLRFGICWQHDGDEQLPSWFAAEQFRVMELDWRESGGSCWARAQVGALWDDEDWYLQLDSHHRFVDGWDCRLLAQANATGSDRPLLSSAAPTYDIGRPPTRAGPTAIRFAAFTDEGVPMTAAELLPERADRRPLRARFVCGHFLFAPGSVVADVPYDPDLYFSREETTLAVRAFTHGYDLHHPGEQLVWHEHAGSYRRRHWDDHSDGAASAISGAERCQRALDRVAEFFANPRVSRYGLGPVRTFADYEAYAGLSFRDRCAQDYTRAHLEPPSPPASLDWPQTLRPRRVELEVELAGLPPKATGPDSFWYVTISDAAGRQLHRRDASPAELAELLAGAEQRVTLIREFSSQAEPAGWTIVPHSPERGWLPPITGQVPVTATA